METIIISGLRSGDEEAYKYLYDYHYGVLCSVACHYVKDYETAEMIVSDIIYAIWKNRANLEIKHTLRSYLLKSVRNGSLTFLNRQSKQINIDVVEEGLFNPIQEEDAPPLSKLIEQELDIKITECIDALPHLTRKIFTLSRFEDLKYEEIASKLNVSVDVVKYHIKSALSRLRNGLKDYLMIIILLLLS